MPVIHIQSLDELNDPALQLYAGLAQHKLRLPHNSAKTHMIVESEIALRVALARGLKPVSFLLNEKKLQALADCLKALPDEIPVFVIPKELASTLVGYPLTRGIFGAFKRPAPNTPQQILHGARHIAVLEDVVDTTNIGAIFRSAAALNVDGIIAAPSCADPFSRRAIRVSMGNSLCIPHVYASQEMWPQTLVELLKTEGFTCVALALNKKACPLDAPQLKKYPKLALFFGTEGTGLSSSVIEACDEIVQIPMSAGVDSLNVAAASAVVFWELCR